MAKPDVSVALLREILRYDPQTGIFFWAKPKSRIRVGNEAGNLINGYRQIGINREQYLAHRLAWLYVHGTWPIHVVDHIDGNPLNNRIDNLRDVPRRTNQQNQRRANRGSESGILGVHRARGKWRARLRGPDGQEIVLGYFYTAEEAGQAYLEGKRRLHAGCTI